jgi:two-component system cell cycle sensor histidine kinase/response regulator CckA
MSTVNDRNARTKQRDTGPAGAPRAGQCDAPLSAGELWRAMFEQNSAVILLIDPTDGQIIDANPAAGRFFGCHERDVRGGRISDITPSSSRDIQTKLEAARTQHGACFILPHHTATGDVCQLEVNASPIRVGGRALLCAVAHDVTERERAAEALRRSAQRYRTLVETIDLGVALVDTERRVVMANRALAQMLGRDAAELIGLRCHDVVCGRGADCHDCPGQDALLDGQRHEHELSVVRADRATFPARVSTLNTIDERGAVSGAIILIEDITEQHATRTRLRAEHEFLETVIRTTPSAIMTVSVNGVVDYANVQTEEVFQLPASDIVGRRYDDPRWEIATLDGAEIPHEDLPFSRVMRTQEPVHDVRMAIVGRDGARRCLSIHGAPLRAANGDCRGAVFCIADITESWCSEQDRRLLLEQLHQAQKMEAVGQLAGGVAHDIGNLLTAIFAHIDITRHELGMSHPAAESVAAIEYAAHEAAHVTRGLLTFSGRTPAARTPLHLQALVRRTMKLVGRLLPAAIERQIEIPDEPALFVEADSTQLQQVLMNLVINARDAMPDGGRLTLRVSAAADPDDASDVPAACIDVSDTGCGMDAAVMRRACEPFFTTKDSGCGTGLGLSVVHGIIKAHGGTLTLDSQPGVGTRFLVRLPTTRAPPPAPAGASEQRGAAGGGSLVLLAEDDAHVRSVLTNVFEGLSYAVVAAGAGLEFIELAQRWRQQARLLIVDFDLPQRDGVSCLRELRATGVQTPAIIISAKADAEALVPQDEQTVFVRKPFLIGDLTALSGRLIRG